jgi:membrane associated rhomboid family serine protease
VRDVAGETVVEPGLHRPPMLTAVVTVITAVSSVASVLQPAFLAAVERSPAGVHSEPWRWLTAMLGQDGGLFGTIGNLAFLVALGIAAEQVVGRWTWLGLYLGAGLVGQAAGYLWLPVGAGNSVAVCGLAGALAWLVVRPHAPQWTGSALVLWLGVLLATWWPPLVGLGLVAAVADRLLVPHPGRHRLVLLGASVVAAGILVAVANVHGAALAAGLVLGGLVVAVDRLRS